MKRLLVLALLLLPIPALAQTYEWTDDSGTVNFAEDLGKVPKKYRKRVKVLGSEEPESPVVAPDASKAKRKPTEPEKEKMELFGGKDQQAWRGEFANAKGQLKAAEQDLADLHGRLSDTTNMSRAEYRTLQNTIKHQELRVQELRKRLDSLSQSADKAGVPPELR